MNSLLNTYCHVTSHVNAHTDDYDAPVEGVFDDCSPLEDIYQTLITDREVNYQASWLFNAKKYTAFDIIIDRIQENVEDGELAAEIFAAVLFNEEKGDRATKLAQASDFETWVYDFFRYMQKKPMFEKPDLSFLTIRFPNE